MTRQLAPKRLPRLARKCPKCKMHRARMCGHLCCECKAKQDFIFAGGMHAPGKCPTYTKDERKKKIARLYKAMDDNNLPYTMNKSKIATDRSRV